MTSQAYLQVEDCTRDVCELSTYHFRYRICNVHIRLPAFMRQGKLQRFCQQCGRSHELSEFEGNQRSCRAQLDRHNARSAHMVPLALYMHLYSIIPALPERAMPSCDWSVGYCFSFSHDYIPCSHVKERDKLLSHRRRQAKKNAQAAKTGAGAQGASGGSQALSSASLTTSGARNGVRAYSADMDGHQRSRAIRPVGKLAAGQAMPAAEAAALLAAVSFQGLQALH